MKFKRLDNVCMAGNVFSLFLYMLYVSDDELESTWYFVGDAIAEPIRDRVPHLKYLKDDHYKPGIRLQKFFYFFQLFLYRWFLCGGKNIFAQDITWFSQTLLGTYDYVLLDDGPGSYFNCLKYSSLTPRKNLDNRSFLRRVIKPIGSEIFGTNRYCIKRLVTQKSDLESSVLKGRNCEWVDIVSRWSQASNWKKEKLKYYFVLSHHVISTLSDARTILLTQPFAKDFELTESDQIEMYRPVIEKYWNDGLVLKLHPRDKTNYSKFFPGLKILDTVTPMQIISMVGVGIKRVITVCSTAVVGLPDNVEIVWLGTSIHPKIHKMLGDIPCPIQR